MVFKSSLLCLLFSLLNTWCYAQVAFSSSNLPIVVINTNGQQIPDDPKITADMGIIYNGPGIRNSITDPFNNYEGKIGIEIRGSSSQMFPKKQYGIELRDDAGNDREESLLGLPVEEDWILFAPYNDKSLMRDALAYKLGRDMGRYAPRTRYCELVLNGEYAGIYVLIEKIKRDKNRVNINKLDPDESTGNNLTGGYIIKIDKSTGSGGDGWISSYTPSLRNADQTIFFQYEVPKSEDIVSEQKSYIKQFITHFENTLHGENFKDPVNGYEKYIDVDSFIDYFIVNEVSKNVDAYRLSTFMHKHRDSEGGKLYMGPIWDFNLGFGNVNYCTNGTTDGFVTDFNSICPADWWLIPFWWARLMEDPTFQQRLSDRWQEVRNGQYKTAVIHTYIDSVASVLNVESQQRNFQRWPVLGQYVWPNYYVGTTFQEEVAWLKNWVTNRMAWLDVAIPVLVTSTSESAATPVTVYPNPFENSVSIRFTLFREGMISTGVYDTYGNTVLPLASSYRNAGEGEEKLQLYTLPAGMYYIKITMPDGSMQIEKLLKVR